MITFGTEDQLPNPIPTRSRSTRPPEPSPMAEEEARPPAPPAGRHRRPPRVALRDRRRQREEGSDGASARSRRAKAEARRGAFRRALIGGFVGLVGVLRVLMVQPGPGAQPLARHGAQRGAAAGCSDVRPPRPTRSGTTSQSGQAYDYPTSIRRRRARTIRRRFPTSRASTPTPTHLPRDDGGAHPRARLGDHVLPADRQIRTGCPNTSSTRSDRSRRTTRRRT